MACHPFYQDSGKSPLSDVLALMHGLAEPRKLTRAGTVGIRCTSWDFGRREWSSGWRRPFEIPAGGTSRV